MCQTESDAIAARAGDRIAAGRLATHFRPYAASLAARFGADEDAVADAMLALVLAIQSYDATRDCPFDVYARAKIRFALLDALRDEPDSCESMDAEAPASESVRTLHDIIADDDAVNPELAAMHAETWARIRALPRAQRYVLLARLGARPEHEIARELCVSDRRVRQIVNETRRALAS